MVDIEFIYPRRWIMAIAATALFTGAPHAEIHAGIHPVPAVIT